MPLTKPASDEKQGDFMQRCMSDLATEFPDEKQRTAVCYSRWNESLQAKYAGIIQEAGKRNKVEDSRVKAFVVECGALLADATPQDEQLAASMQEADAILTWLKEQAAFKSEDGVQYPAEAFAYVTDAEKPSDWKLRLWEDAEKKVTKTQLRYATAYLSEGGFRGQKVAIASADLPAVKRKIRTEYSKLGIEDTEIPKWVQEANMNRTVIADYIPLTEATIGSKGNAQIVVIKPGLNTSKERYYPAEILGRDFGVFENVKMYADHPSEADEKNRPERSVRDWVATLKNVHVDKAGTVIGEAVVVEPWMQERLATLRDKGMLADIGVSINAIGTASKGTIDGVKTNVIERIVRARSVDFVTEAGAGGGVRLYEAESTLDVDLVNLDILKERRADLVKLIESEVETKYKLEVKRHMEQDEKVKELETSNATLTTELSELKGKITLAEKAQRIAEAKSVIDEAISKSELPEAAKKRIAEKFAGVEVAEGITEAIKAEIDYVSALKETGKVKGMGATKSDPDADRKALKESFKRLGMDDAQAETAVVGR
jgi:hypothetical protein